MEAVSPREATSRRESKRAVVCFALLLLFLALMLYYDPKVESALWSGGCIFSAVCMFVAIRRNRNNVPAEVYGRRVGGQTSRLSRLTLMVGIIILSVILFAFFDAVLADIWAKFVPGAVSGFVEGMTQGVGIGIFIYLLSSYSGILGLSGEDVTHALRSLKIAAVVMISALIFLAGIYVAIEHVIGPVVRFFA